MSEAKLYVITRRDLAPSVRAVMAIHVATDWAFSMGWVRITTEGAWTEHGPPVVLMQVKTRHRLERLAVEHPAHTYTDPDVADGICAIAIYAEHWNHDWARMVEFAEPG